jgi:hypothetical protein
MHCLYCQKRLWTFFSKERMFCSKLHEAAYHDALSAMNRLMELAVPGEPRKGPATPDQKRSGRERELRTPMVCPVAVPPICNLVVEQGRPKPVAAVLTATAVPLECVPFAGPIQFPSRRIGLIPLTPDPATEHAAQIATTANEWIAACRVQSKRSRRIPARRPAAFSSRTHRRRPR